jgi:hypothetical protein
MREGLRASVEAARGRLEGYPKGSVVLCAACGRPLYRLRRAIEPGASVARSVTAYGPVTPADLEALAELAGLAPPEAEVRAARQAYCARIPEVRTGQPACCPFCGLSWVRVWAPTASELVDRAYTWTLVVLPPLGRVGRRIRRRWRVEQAQCRSVPSSSPSAAG